MKYLETNVQKWHSEVRRFEFDIEPLSDTKVLFFGHENWLTYFSNNCYTLSYEEIDFKQYGNEIDFAIFVLSLDLRKDKFSQEIATANNKAIEVIKTLKDYNIKTISIILNQDIKEVYAEIFDMFDYNIDLSLSNKTSSHPQEGLFCSFTYNPYLDEFAMNKLKQYPFINIVAQNSHILRNSENMKRVAEILKKDLILFDYDYTSRIYRLDEATKHTTYLGQVNEISYRSILKKSKIQLFFDDNIVSDEQLKRQIIESAACYTVPIIVTQRVEYFEKVGAVAVGDIYKMLDFVSLLYNSNELRENIAQQLWRLVHSKYSIYSLLLKLNYESLPLASMITPTVRPENIDRILQNYDSQTYENKELIIVLNGHPKEIEVKALHKKIENRKDINVVKLSSDVLAAGALNAGIIKAQGKIVFRIDDDDIYGPNYINDVMWHHFSTNADFLGKKMEYIYLKAEGKTYRRKINNKNQTFMLDIASEMYYNIAGNSFALRRSFALNNAFRPGTAGFADSDFLISILSLRQKPLSLYVDSNSLIIVRNNPNEHTWEAKDEFFKKDSIQIFNSNKWIIEDIDWRKI